jgi:hypothetical protein
MISGTWQEYNVAAIILSLDQEYSVIVWYVDRCKMLKKTLDNDDARAIVLPPLCSLIE